MIPLDKFLACVQENADRAHDYEQGHDGSDGKCDCIGLIIGALALAGFKWPGVHGSNWAARNAMDGLNYIDTQYDTFLGEIVYKAKSPGEAGYNLPDKYKTSGDLLDYYHVGVVTGIDPLVITHCTTVDGGIKRDSKMGAWKYGGRLKYVDYDNEKEEPDMETPYQAVVMADSGKTVNMRAKPDIKATIIDRVDIGETVTVLDELGEWDKATGNGGKTGYMMDKYLRPINEDVTNEQEQTVTVNGVELETWADTLESLLNEIRDKIGRG